MEVHYLFSSPNIIRVLFVISGFRGEEDALLGCYAADWVAIPYRRFGTNYRLRNYQYTLLNSPEERISLFR